MTDEEKKAEEYIINKYKLNKCYIVDTEETRIYMHNDVHSEYEEEYQIYLDGLKEGRKEKELSYKVGKITKAELNKCKTIEEKMEWLGKVLAYWVNVQKSNIIDQLEKENAELSNSVTELTNTKNELENKVTELKQQIEKMKNKLNCTKYLYINSNDI